MEVIGDQEILFHTILFHKIHKMIGGFKGRNNLWNLSQDGLTQMSQVTHQHHHPPSLLFVLLLQEKLMMSRLIYLYNEKSMKSLMMMTLRKHKDLLEVLNGIILT
jgi:hypothetical protein